MSATYRVPTGEHMRELGSAIASILRAGDLLILSGGLGAGKTTLVQGIGAGLGVDGAVASPTFIIARTHKNSAGPDLIHVDAYRLASLQELDHLDLDASLEDSVTVVEWGEGKAEALATEHVHVTIDRPRGAAPEGQDPAEGERVITVDATGSSWSGRNWPAPTDLGWDA